MYFRSILSTTGLLFLVLSYAATVPANSDSHNDDLVANLTAIKETLQILKVHDSSSHSSNIDKISLTFNENWPPAPFGIRSLAEAPWILDILSYEPSRLAFRQVHALLWLCTNAQDILSHVAPSHPMGQQSWTFRATPKRPYDLSREDVELEFYNSRDEPGTAYTAGDMIATLNMMVEMLLPKDFHEMTSTVLHYAELRPIKGTSTFRKVKIQRKRRNSIDSVTIA
ncbi:MAG: hypothetical protein Q9219_005375 [cf. Caloplaca sp. 3 TL-2023]